ncbi:hypothetical protein [Ferrimonas marina]|nr:hypothetical protein [Ferrimonas marina]
MADRQFELAPLFIWGTSLSGDATLGSRDAPLDLDFRDDVLDNLDGAYTLRLEGPVGPVALFAEYQYFDLSPATRINNLEARVDFESTLFELGVAKTLGNSGTTRWDLLGGARYLDHDVRVSASFGDGGRIPATNGGDDWWQGFVGGRVWHQLSDRWQLSGRADLGYGGSDNSSVNLQALAKFRFAQWGNVFLGYRAFWVDYEGGDSNLYRFDATLQGPVLGLSFRF